MSDKPETLWGFPVVYSNAVPETAWAVTKVGPLPTTKIKVPKEAFPGGQLPMLGGSFTAPDDPEFKDIRFIIVYAFEGPANTPYEGYFILDCLEEKIEGE